MKTIYFSVCPLVDDESDDQSVWFTASLTDGRYLDDDPDSMEYVEDYLEKKFPNLNWGIESECIYSADGVTPEELRSIFNADENMSEEDPSQFFSF